MTDLRKAAEMALETLEMTVPYLPAKTATLSEVEETITELRQALAQPEQKPECIGVIGNWGRVEWSNGVFPQLGDRLYTAPPKREWVGLSSLDKTFLRTAYAQLRPLYYDKKEDVSVAAEVVTDWDGFFTAINDMLKEKNLG